MIRSRQLRPHPPHRHVPRPSAAPPRSSTACSSRSIAIAIIVAVPLLGGKLSAVFNKTTASLKS